MLRTMRDSRVRDIFTHVDTTDARVTDDVMMLLDHGLLLLSRNIYFFLTPHTKTHLAGYHDTLMRKPLRR